MSSASDFVIENGVLIKYVGPGGDVVVPEGVTEIGAYDFRDPSRSSFRNCTKVTSVVLPNSLKRIGSYAFSDCNNLDTIVFPNEMEFVAGGAFDDTLWKEKQPKGFVRAGNVLLRYTGESPEVVIPDGITVFANGAFVFCKQIESVVVPTSITKIARGTFQYCSKLYEIKLPETLQAIGDAAFDGCSSLERITIPDSVNEIGKDVFKSCNPKLIIHYGGKQYAALPKSSRAYMQFLWLRGEEPFSLPQEGIIKKEIFRLKKEYFAALKWGGSDVDAWRRCDDQQEGKLLTKLQAQEKLPWDDVNALNCYLSCGKWSIEEIEQYSMAILDQQHPQMAAALLSYKNQHFTDEKTKNATEKRLESQLDPTSPEVIKESWRFLKDSKTGGYKITEYIGCEAFPVMPEMIGRIPVTAVSNEAFRGCMCLKGMTLSENLKLLGQAAFADCYNLEEIRLPNGLKNLPKSIFRGCEKLKRVELPAQLETIEPWTFSPRCDAYEKISFANFQLEEIIISKDNPFFGTADGVLYEKKSGKILHFPAKKKSFVVPSEITKIPSAAFALSEIGSIVLHPEIVQIGSMAFYGCTYLQRVNVPSGKTKEIGMYAFAHCTNLEELHLPANVKKIGAFAVDLDSKLTIFAPAGSYAEQYAKENNIPFVAE